jgi:CD164 antigen
MIYILLGIANGTGLTSANSTSLMPTTTSQIVISKTIPVASSSTTAHPTPAITTAKQTQKDTGRKFDGLSFFGGIILGAVICVLLLFSVKYYQAKKRSYHSL